MPRKKSEQEPTPEAVTLSFEVSKPLYEQICASAKCCGFDSVDEWLLEAWIRYEVIMSVDWNKVKSNATLYNISAIESKMGVPIFPPPHTFQIESHTAAPWIQQER